MYLTQKNHLRGLSSEEYEILRSLTRLSKNIYNVTLWEIRQHYEQNGKFLGYTNAYHKVKENKNYELIPSQVGQQTMKILCSAYRSFFGSLKVKAKRNSSINHVVNPPSFLPRDGHFVCVFPKDMFKMVDNQIRLSLGRWFAQEMNQRYLFFDLPPMVDPETLKEVRIVPRYKARFFEIVFIYETEGDIHDFTKDEFLSIDLGLDNYATCVDTNGTAFIIEGRGLKSYNRWWNKERSRLQSIYDKQGIKFGDRLAHLLYGREKIINNFMNQSVNHIIQHCLENGIKTIVIGDIKDIKQNANLGRKTNQNFLFIPFSCFKQKLRSKCAYYGLNYVEVNEAYTSQTCSHCGIRRKANRKHRGLYVCNNCGIVLNADVNGSINILMKVAPESSYGKIWNSGRVNRPFRIRVVDFKSPTKHFY